MTLSEFIESKTKEVPERNFFIHTFKDNILEVTEYTYLRDYLFNKSPVITAFTRYELELTKTNNVIKSTIL